MFSVWCLVHSAFGSCLVFTGGIGENSVRMRADICEGLGWMGVAVDPVANAANAVQIGGAAVQVLVLPTDEERVIAAAVLGLAES